METTEKKTTYHRPGLREDLVAAGRILLEEKGLRGFTLRECARRADVSHAAPAHHFASINDLLAEIATRGFGELKATISSFILGPRKPSPLSNGSMSTLPSLASRRMQRCPYQVMFIGPF